MKRTSKTIFTLLVAAIGIFFFSWMIVGIYVRCLSYHHPIMLLAAIIATLIPGLICQGIIRAGFDFVKSEIADAKNR